MKIGGWKYFGNKEFPENGKDVTIIWNDGAETDCVWESEGMDWEAELIPVSWKYIEEDDSNIPEDFGTHQYHDIG